MQCVQNLLGYLLCGLCYLEVKWLGHVIGLHLTSQGTGKLSSLAADFFLNIPHKECSRVYQFVINEEH